ncbi:MAG: carbon storage regulator CsrA [Porticoccaceae bacterium]
MLILTRKLGETVVIDHDIRVTVLAVKGGQIKIGIDAPRDVDIVREELIIDEEWRKN